MWWRGFRVLSSPKQRSHDSKMVPKSLKLFFLQLIILKKFILFTQIVEKWVNKFIKAPNDLKGFIWFEEVVITYASVPRVSCDVNHLYAIWKKRYYWHIISKQTEKLLIRRLIFKKNLEIHYFHYTLHLSNIPGLKNEKGRCVLRILFPGNPSAICQNIPSFCWTWLGQNS